MRAIELEARRETHTHDGAVRYASARAGARGTHALRGEGALRASSLPPSSLQCVLPLAVRASS